MIEQVVFPIQSEVEANNSKVWLYAILFLIVLVVVFVIVSSQQNKEDREKLK